jgi:nucleolar protein 14
MLGQDLSDSDDDDAGGRRRKRPRGGDDLDDDFMEGESFGGLGAGLGVEPGSDASESDEGEDGGAEDSDEEHSDEEHSDEEHSDEEVDFDAFGEDNQESSSDEAFDVEEEDTTGAGTKRKAQRSSGTLKAAQELPYTFPAPESHDEFLD